MGISLGECFGAQVAVLAGFPPGMTRNPRQASHMSLSNACRPSRLRRYHLEKGNA